jgi:predicted Zn-dependent protease
MEISHQRAERFYLKLILGALVAIALLIAVFWGGHDLYVRWQERRLIRVAVFAIEHGDERTASLAARTVLELRPSSVPAARIMAQLAEKAGDRVALDWRRKVLQLEPQSTDDALAWARCALQFNDIATAERALREVNEQGKQSAGYHAAAALLAQAREETDKAESEWGEATRLAPEEKAYQLQLGMVRLHSSDSERHASGETMLKALRGDSKQRIFATRALISDGVAHHADAQRVLELARELQSYPEATFSDHLMLLDFLHQLQDAQFTAYLTELEKNSANNAVDLSALLSWMSQKNLNLLALDFVKTLPAEVTEKWPVPLAVADIHTRLKDWRKLENVTKAANWRQFDFLRHAYLARALRGQDKPAATEHEWAAAVKGASAQSESMLSLVRVTSEWKWDSETVELLWTLAKLPEKQKEALQILYRFYAKNSDTGGLYRVLVRLSESDPNNLNVENNLAQVSLLLNANAEEARRLAADVYHKMPSNAAYTTTYAYSLLTKGDTKNAVRIMSSLTEEQLRDPTISAYYGLCLAAAKNQKARNFLEAGQKATLLPEERTLIDKALNGLEPPREAD